MLMIVSDKGTKLDSQLGTGTNTTAAPPSGSPSATAVINNPDNGQLNGGGSAEGNRGDGSASSNSNNTNTNTNSEQTGTSFNQGGGTSQASSREISRLVALGSALVALVVGGMFTLL
jgi:hypothetical protein